jgi:glycine cleavage system aminomethyltransferase T
MSTVGFGAQIRQSPFFEATLRWGAKGFSVYNHMYIPRDFGDPVQNFWNLVERAILCDVAVERQVEITGRDAADFVQLLTPRYLSSCAVGQCKYVLLTSQEGGIVNDPVLLRLGATSGYRLQTATFCSGRKVLLPLRAWLSTSASPTFLPCSCRARGRWTS